VRENGIALHKWSGGTAQLRSLEGTLLVDSIPSCELNEQPTLTRRLI